MGTTSQDNPVEPYLSEAEEIEEDEETVVAGIERFRDGAELTEAVQETFADKVAKVEKAVYRNPLHRELLYKVLEFCQQRRLLREVEDQIATFPEFGEAHQSQYILMTYLINDGGLETFELDEQGNVVTAEQKVGLSEDEIDDLVFDFAYQTTAAGLEVAKQMRPQSRLESLFDATPVYHDTYIEVLEYLRDKHSMAEVDTLLRGRDVLRTGREPDESPMQASVFIDKLEKAGAIVWNEGWETTEEGREVLENSDN
jgi:hypothetical protein